MTKLSLCFLSDFARDFVGEGRWDCGGGGKSRGHPHLRGTSRCGIRGGCVTTGDLGGLGSI